MVRSLSLLPLLFAGASAIKGNFNDKTFKKAIEGKNAFVFFQAPW